MFGIAAFCATTFTGSGGAKNAVSWTQIPVDQNTSWVVISTAPTPQQK